MLLKQIIQNITTLYESYGDTGRNKIYDIINKELPERIQNFVDRRRRIEELEMRSKTYISNFLHNSDTQYCYIPNTDIFIKYNGQEFKLINETDILHDILSQISQNKQLMPWKHKIKQTIMKRIKKQRIFDITPESHTIQFVISHLFPLLFQTKEETKYFLSVLGDNILKKNPNLFHIVDIKHKNFITALVDNLFSYFKNVYHLDSTFKYMWYDHEYNKCRILNLNKSTKSMHWNSFVKYHILDIVSVAVYYSNRYGSSEIYISTLNTNLLDKTNITFLIDKTEADIVSTFVESNIIKMPNVNISWNEMYYIWKEYLKSMNLPSIMFLKNLKFELSKHITLNNDDKFINATSTQLKIIKNLHEFWEKYMSIGENDEFEISELHEIYSSWLSSQHKSHISEESLTSLINHFYKLELKDGKYLSKISCSLWKKQDELRAVINSLRADYKFSPEPFEKGVHNIYIDYCKVAKERFNYNIVSKKYFEKYINQIIPDKYIIKNRISKCYWRDN